MAADFQDCDQFGRGVVRNVDLGVDVAAGFDCLGAEQATFDAAVVIIDFDDAKTRFGQCRYTPKEISLSRPLTKANDEEQVRDTILHEIAHALTPGEGHGNVWKKVAIKIGCDGKRCYDSKSIITPESKYMATEPG
ncbi:MAG: hypothetical protein EBT12_05555, partial [Marivivens sp.]|nr:hypothetical protein [Marivivens sp.]